ncbi:MAG: hypothetical protein HQL14_02720 [Candidatus Omnitrophica bacterium]|nr:hypothetical protein [Candidatus Omnitrophota bacterium]
MSNTDRDLVMSHLRLHVNRLNTLLTNMEEQQDIDSDFLCDSLKDVESDIHHLRRILGKSGFQNLILGRNLFY